MRLLVLFIVFCLTLNAHADQRTISGPVASVHDGDTIRVVVDGKQEKIRLWGIDAAELKQLCGTAKCGEMARDALAQAIAGKDVTCTIKGRSYDRLVGQCRTEETDIGSLMTRIGMAWSERKHSNGFYSAEEKEAQGERLGIWSMRTQNPARWRACNLPGRKDRPADCAL